MIRSNAAVSLRFVSFRYVRPSTPWPGPRDAFPSPSRRRSPPPQRTVPLRPDTRPSGRRPAAGAGLRPSAPTRGAAPPAATPTHGPWGPNAPPDARRRSAPTPPPRFTSELIAASARRKLSSSRGRSSVGRRGEVEFGLGPADVARVIVVGDRPPRPRRCADSGRPSPSRAAPSTPQPSTPSRRPQLNSWYVIF